MVAANQVRNPETELVEATLRREYPRTDVYRYNCASIRVRIVDERFQGLSLVDRHEHVLPLIHSLPEETQLDITVLLLLAPDELQRSLLNFEFEAPTPSEF